MEPLQNATFQATLDELTELRNKVLRRKEESLAKGWFYLAAWYSDLEHAIQSVLDGTGGVLPDVPAPGGGGV